MKKGGKKLEMVREIYVVQWERSARQDTDLSANRERIFLVFAESGFKK